ncbi:hypothetical protein N657DRAFT_139072 [Parathielavia appendiculata]|uniref:Uncharacterized protein n=1 Tax=Parathielavia appendiculata TaxID=2587402 RepID=A0AAN6TU30_9PEZI|nr:hypothetical protein N657DRAFT_139072 [Parathielavia appendiculata]
MVKRSCTRPPSRTACQLCDLPSPWAFQSTHERRLGARMARHEKPTLGWTALFYAVRNANYHITRLLLESGASNMLSSIRETPPMVAVRQRAEDIFWLLIEFGFWPAWTTSRHSRPLRYPPEFVDQQIAQMTSPAALIEYLETFLLQSFDPQLSQPSTAAFCARCLARPAGAEPAAQEAWRVEQSATIARWIPITDAFSYGFLRRCRICRQPVVALPPPFDANLGSKERVIVLPSDYPSWIHAHNNNSDGSCLCLFGIFLILEECTSKT